VGEARSTSEFDVSVVIPLGPGDGGIGGLLTGVRALAHELGGRTEVVLVDDGLPHGFESIAARWRSQFAGMAVASHGARKGRGAAARSGILGARGQHLLVVDPDLEVSLDNAVSLLDALRRGSDVALVSRKSEMHDSAEAKSFLERASETTLMRLSQLMVPLGVRDCFSGLISLRTRAAKKIAQRSRVSSSAYPVEWLALAQYLGFQVVEFPLQAVRGPLLGDRGRRKNLPLALLMDVWATRRRFAKDDYSTAVHAQELLSETSFRKLDVVR
jgi:hypothetical protein